MISDSHSVFIIIIRINGLTFVVSVLARVRRIPMIPFLHFHPISHFFNHSHALCNTFSPYLLAHTLPLLAETSNLWHGFTQSSSCIDQTISFFLLLHPSHFYGSHEILSPFLTVDLLITSMRFHTIVILSNLCNSFIGLVLLSFHVSLT